MNFDDFKNSVGCFFWGILAIGISIPFLFLLDFILWNLAETILVVIVIIIIVVVVYAIRK